MSFFKFIFICFGFFLFLKIFRVIRYLIFFEKREKFKTFKEGEVFIYKTNSKEKTVEIQSKTVDFEEVKEDK